MKASEKSALADKAVDQRGKPDWRRLDKMPVRGPFWPARSICPSVGRVALGKIYVQIPAYRDEELSATLLSLYRNAARPDRLRVRVLWQRGPDEQLAPEVSSLPNLEIEAVAASASMGCNWARKQLQAAWSGEPFTLLLDSHHRFVRGWDQKALGMFEQLRHSGVTRPLLTAYLPGYNPHDPRRRHRQPYKIYPFEREDGLLTRLTSHPIRDWARLQSPVKADFISLHFILAEGRFNRDVPMDPSIYFFGDEVHTSLRAFEQGYRFFHPHRVLGWHAYDRASRRPHWADHPNWHHANNSSLDLLKRRYGRGAAGANGSLAEFELYSGVELYSR